MANQKTIMNTSTLKKVEVSEIPKEFLSFAKKFGKKMMF